MKESVGSNMDRCSFETGLFFEVCKQREGTEYGVGKFLYAEEVWVEGKVG